MHKQRLAILATHPIQYHAPFFCELSRRPEIELEVFYCHSATPSEQASAGFGIEFNWDVSLLEGYQHRSLKNIAPLPSLSGFRGLDTPEIYEIIKEGEYDAVIINGWHYKSAWQAMRACWRTSTPVMLRSDSHLHNPRTLAKRVAKKPLYSWFIPKLNACLAVGTWSKEYFHHYGARDDRVFIVPHVIDDKRFNDQAQLLRSNRDGLRQSFGLSTQSTVFMFVGKFVEQKRPLSFVRAIAEASAANERITGLMVGDGPLREECETLVRQKGVPIKFAGFLNQSEIARAYVASDMLVLPSASESWGLVVNEAMTCGVPALVSDKVGCAPDLVSAGQTGDVFRVDDTVELAQMIAAYAERRCELTAMGSKAKERIAAHSVQNVATTTLKVLTVVNQNQ